jgi:hypothetical protein
MGNFQSEHLLRPARAAEVIHSLAKTNPLSTLVVPDHAIVGDMLEFDSAFTERIKKRAHQPRNLRLRGTSFA